MAMDRRFCLGIQGAQFVNGVADDIHNAAERRRSHRNCNRAAQVDGTHAADHAVSRQHRYSTHASLAKVLLHLCDDTYVLTLKTLAGYPESLIDRRQIVIRKLNVHNGADDLHNLADMLP